MSDTRNAEMARWLRKQLDEVGQAHEAAVAQARDLEEWKQSLQSLLRRYDPDEAPPTLDPAVQSTRAQLVQLARANSGLLITKQAIPALVDAGVFPSKDAANRAVFDTLRKGTKFFEKLGPGRYRYIGEDAQRTPASAALWEESA